MIIDSHTHIFPDKIAKKAVGALLETAQKNTPFKAFSDGTKDGLLKSMDKAGVDYSVILPILTKPEQFDANLKWATTLRKENPRLLFLASIHPKDTDLKEHFKILSEEGFKGIKLHPQYQGFNADSKELYPLYELALKHNLFIHFHAGKDIGFPGSSAASAERFANVIKDFPNLTIVLAHGGGVEEWESSYQFFHDKNVYFDISFAIQALKNKEPFITKLCFEREDFIFFGTDSPWRDQKEEVQNIKNLDILSESQKEKILYKNALKILGPIK